MFEILNPFISQEGDAGDAPDTPDAPAEEVAGEEEKTPGEEIPTEKTEETEDEI